MRQETDSMCTMECFSVLFTKFYYFLLILKIISWNWLAILHLYPRWSSQQHIYILFTLSSFFVCLHISPQTEGVRTLQIMSKTSHRAKIHRTGGQNPSYRGQKSNIPCYNIKCIHTYIHYTIRGFNRSRKHKNISMINSAFRNNPYLALMGELWGVYCTDWLKKRNECDVTVPHCIYIK